MEKIDSIDLRAVYDNSFCDQIRDERISMEIPVCIRIISFNGSWYTGVANSYSNPEEKCLCRIPKTWISLNAERNYERWIGQDVYAIPVREIKEEVPLEDGRIRTVRVFICSRRLFLEYHGNRKLQDLYTKCFSPGAERDESGSECFSATVTGVIGTASVCGVFMELDDMNINGFLHCDNYELVDYRIGDKFNVGIRDIRSSGKPYSESPNGNIKETGLEVILFK